MKDSETQSSYVGFEALLEKLGFGKWTLFMFATYVFWALMIPYFSMGGAFYNPLTEHWCHVPELHNNSWTEEQRLNYSVPWELRSGSLRRSRCTIYDRNYSDVAGNEWLPEYGITSEEGRPLPVKPCKQWSYDTSVFASTVTMEWDLVCDNAGWSPFFQSFYFIGITVGEPLLGYFGDKFGRRFTLRGSSIIFTTVAFASAFAPYYSLVLTGRFILGILHASIGVGYVYAMEACPPKYRTISGLFLTAPFALTGIAFGVFAYFIRSWRTLQVVCAIPTLMALFYIPFMDESPRWEIIKGRKKGPLNSLRKAAKWHKVSITDDNILKIIEEEQSKSLIVQEEDDSSPTSFEMEENAAKRSKKAVIISWIKDCFILVRTPVLRRITLAMFVCWFSTGLTYWGMSLSGTSFSSDPFLYMIFSSLAEIPGYSAFVPFVSRFGRKIVLAVNFVICSVSILSILVIPQDWKWTVFALALIGKLFITGCYNLLYLYSSELFPTVVRAKGLNLSSMMGRIGSISSPFIIKLLAATYWWTPSLVFGCAAALGMIGTLFLPESKDNPLSDTVEQVEILYGPKSADRASTLI